MLILAFESSCDETSASVVERVGESFRIKSNIIASQIETHSATSMAVAIRTLRAVSRLCRWRRP